MSSPAPRSYCHYGPPAVGVRLHEPLERALTEIARRLTATSGPVGMHLGVTLATAIAAAASGKNGPERVMKGDP